MGHLRGDAQEPSSPGTHTDVDLESSQYTWHGSQGMDGAPREKAESDT